MELRYNEPLYNEVLGITNDFFTPVIVKCMEKNLDRTKPRYSERILPVPLYMSKINKCIESKLMITVIMFLYPLKTTEVVSVDN